MQRVETGQSRVQYTYHGVQPYWAVDRVYVTEVWICSRGVQPYWTVDRVYVTGVWICSKLTAVTRVVCGCTM